MNDGFSLIQSPGIQTTANPAHAFVPGVGLSIVVPVYRGATTIGTLVEELSRLTPEGGLEVILVNDGSPDNSDEACRALLKRSEEHTSELQSPSVISYAVF